ncbi:MAG: isocitrate lyase/PEP mutase family protein [Alphaproteobacteria bacterium]|nr:isocitrate lyase/PEP mutase family protein [Alphaproteobacteria bacterium]
MRRPSLSAALAAERPLVTPLAHDALSARLIARAGFRAFTVGGSALLAARHGFPDIGLIGVKDMADGLRDIAAACDLPFFADADDGYGDVKSVARTVADYEAIGVGGLLIEDQHRDRKQQRADKAAAVVDEAVIEQKLRTALAVRSGPETLIIGRTDAYGALGLDAALRRAERFLKLGVDGVFIAGLRTPEDYARVGKALNGAILLAAMFEGSGTPWIAPAELGAMGFRQVSYPVTLMLRVVAALQGALAELRAHALGTRAMTPLADGAAIRAVLDDAVELKRWREIETRFGGDAAGKGS